jgi:glycine/D-amino acid oxidase-like deaminating enzyme
MSILHERYAAGADTGQREDQRDQCRRHRDQQYAAHRPGDQSDAGADDAGCPSLADDRTQDAAGEGGTDQHQHQQCFVIDAVTLLPALARRLGLDLPIQIIRSSVGQTTPVATFTRVGLWGPKCAYRPAADGSLVIGNGYRGVGADYDITPNSLRHLRHFLPAYRLNWRLLRLRFGREFLGQLLAATSERGRYGPLPEPRANIRKVDHNLRQLRALFPHLGAIALARSWAGRIDLTPDVIPIIDKPKVDADLYVAAGFSGHGFALGPSVGRQLSGWIVDGRPTLDLAPFRLARFTDGTATIQSKAL